MAKLKVSASDISITMKPGKKKKVASVSYGNCTISVLGMDMNCPLCKVLVKSGQRHQCHKESA
jgi:hypothetical protein